MIKVAIDTSPLETGHKTRGMGYYIRNLIDSLEKHTDIKVIKGVNDKDLKDVDLIHYPYFDFFDLSLPLVKKKPLVVTIGDMTPIKFSKHYPPGIKGRIKHQFQKGLVKKSDAIITFSQNSKKDISKYLKINKNKIYPIFLAAADFFKPIKDMKKYLKIKDKYNLPEKFVLFVGSVNWNKNIVSIAQAAINADVNILFIGKDFERVDNLDHTELKSYKEFIKRFKDTENVYRLGFVDNEDLVILYNMAELLLFPTYYEGFGLPILEAQACGTPVITSSVSSMPEVAGRGALYVNPQDIEEITKAILKVSKNEKLKENLIKDGLENVRRFSWRKTAEETAKVYEQIVHK